MTGRLRRISDWLERRPWGRPVQRIFHNAGKLIGARAVAGAVSLIYLAVATRSLGPAGFGVLTLVHLYALTVGGVIVVPGWHAVVRYGAISLANDRREDLFKLLRFTTAVEVATGVLAMAAVAGGAGLAAHLLSWPPAVVPLATLYSITVIGNLRSTPTGALYLLGRFDLIAASQALGPLIRLAGSLVAAWMHAGVTGFLIAWLVAGMSEGVLQWSFGVYALHRAKLLTGLVGSPRGATAAHPGLWAFLMATNFDLTLSDLGARVTPLIVGWQLGPAAAGLYQLALRAGMVLAQPAQIVGQAALPELSKIVAAGDTRALARSVRHASLLAGLAGLPIWLVFVAFGRIGLGLLGGPGFQAAYVVLLLVGGARLITLAGASLGPAMLALGRPGRMLQFNALATLGSLPVLVGLIRVMGLAGAGVHAVIQALVLVGAMAWFVLADLARRRGALPEPAPRP